MIRVLALVVLLFSVTFGLAHAQFTSSDPLTVSISPEYPKPYDTVTVTPSSTLIDLSSATIKVSVNGKLVSSFSGAEGTTVTVGAPGVKTTVTVTATTGGKTYRKTLVIATGDVALVVEPLSTAHPLYKGALLLAPQGRVRVIAIADLRNSSGVRLNPAGLVYTWRLGSQILEADSGIEKSVLTAVAPQRYRDAQISVTVTTSDGAVVAKETTLLQPTDPIVRIYRTDPLLGTDFTHALMGTYSLTQNEESFRGVPYFFGAVPTFSWIVGGQGSGTSDEVTVRTSGGGAGKSSLSLSARLNETHQSVTNTLSLSFGNLKSTNIFGF
jgi:hypothetical protein